MSRTTLHKTISEFKATVVWPITPGEHDALLGRMMVARLSGQELSPEDVATLAEVDAIHESVRAEVERLGRVEAGARRARAAERETAAFVRAQAEERARVLAAEVWAARGGQDREAELAAEADAMRWLEGRTGVAVK